jgi:hypothetical protein
VRGIKRRRNTLEGERETLIIGGVTGGGGTEKQKF